MDKLSVSGPWITEKEIQYVTDAVTNAWYHDANVYHEKFEKAFSEYIGMRHAVALPSCTAAIHLALLALGIGDKDEVIVPDLTWIATSAPVSYVGAIPVFADVEKDTWCISAASIGSLITDRTKAIIPVDLYGNVPDMEAIHSIAKKYNLAIIEDAAEAIGAQYGPQKAGSLGDIGVFSFHGSKTLTTGEGGMLVTNSKEIYEKVLFYRDHGRVPGSKQFWNAEVAYKYKMSSMQAALGLAQLERVKELVDRKRQIFLWYQEELQNICGLTLNFEPKNTRNAYWMVTVILDKRYKIEKEGLIEKLGAAGIDTRPFFYPLSSIPAYANTIQGKHAQENNLVSYSLSPYGINLPCGMNMTKNKINYVCDTIKSIIGVF